MENAAKALLIVGSVLIAILLLTLFSYLFTKMHEDTSRIQETMEQNEKLRFNQQFLLYDGLEKRIIGYENGDQSKPIYGFLTVQDVATIMNLAKEINKSSKFPTTIKVMYNAQDLAKTQYTEEWLKSKASSNAKFGCTVNVNSTTLLVDNITITDI